MADETDISARLPAPRDDEPRELRQDIVDELADHLACAVNRERLLQGGASEAGTTDDAGADAAGGATGDPALLAALEKFGDPAAVARRLWWDAMKERIMTQRIVSIAAFAACAASIACVAFMWRIVENNREAQTALVEAQRETNAAFIAELREAIDRGFGTGQGGRVAIPALGEGAVALDFQPAVAPVAARATPHSENWWPLTVKLVDEAGKPIEGFVNYSAESTSAGKVSDYMQTGSEGVAEFGALPSGQYNISVGSNSGLYATKTALLGPGRPTVISFICPTLVEVEPRIEIDVPEDLREEPLYFLAVFQTHYMTSQNLRWDDRTQSVQMLFTKDGTLLGETREQATGGGVPRAICSVDGTAKKVRAGHYTIWLYAYIPSPAEAAQDAELPQLDAVLNFSYINRHCEQSASSETVCKFGAGAEQQAGKSQPEEERFWNAIREQLKNRSAAQSSTTATARTFALCP